MTAKRQTGRQLEPPAAAEALLTACYYRVLLGHAPFVEDLRQLYADLDAELGAAGKPSGLLGVGGVDATGLLGVGPDGLRSLAQANRRGVAAALARAETACDWARHWREAVPELSLFAEQAARGWLAHGGTALKDALWQLAERRRALTLLAELAAERAARTRIEAFIQRWPLPATASEDLRQSHRWWVAAGRPDTPLLLPNSVFAELGGEELGGEAGAAVLVGGLRLPPLPDRLEWRPWESVAALRDRLQRVYAEHERLVLERAEALRAPLVRAEAREAAAGKERAATPGDAGWRPTPPHELRPEAVMRRARWLVQRLVLGWTFERIADTEAARAAEAEDEPEPEPVDADAVRKAVTRDARRLGLPHRR